MADAMMGASDDYGDLYQRSIDVNGSHASHTKTRSKLKRKLSNDNGQVINLDTLLHDADFPSELEAYLASTIFEIGLRHSSPKILINLMDQCVDLNTEHIKSHLQKYRIHSERSLEEFLSYYNSSIMNHFHCWDSEQDWLQIVDPKGFESSSSPNADSDNTTSASQSCDQVISGPSDVVMCSISLKSLNETEELLSNCVSQCFETFSDCEYFVTCFKENLLSADIVDKVHG